MRRIREMKDEKIMRIACAYSPFLYPFRGMTLQRRTSVFRGRNIEEGSGADNKKERRSEKN